MFDRIHHAGLAVADLAVAKTVFADRLGLIVDTTRSPLPEGNKQRGADPTDILDIPIGNSELELNAPPSDAGARGRIASSSSAAAWAAAPLCRTRATRERCPPCDRRPAAHRARAGGAGVPTNHDAGGVLPPS